MLNPTSLQLFPFQASALAAHTQRHPQLAEAAAVVDLPEACTAIRLSQQTRDPPERTQSIRPASPQTFSFCGKSAFLASWRSLPRTMHAALWEMTCSWRNRPTSWSSQSGRTAVSSPALATRTAGRLAGGAPGGSGAGGAGAVPRTPTRRWEEEAAAWRRWCAYDLRCGGGPHQPWGL